MGALSNYAEASIVNHFLRNTAVSSPVTVYLALYESDPGEANTGDETAYTDYARQASTWEAINGSGQTMNAGSIAFPANGNAVASVIITHAAVFDALTGGNMIIYGALSSPKTLEVDDILSFAINSVTLTLD
jgi:hypothetical protein